MQMAYLISRSGTRTELDLSPPNFGREFISIPRDSFNSFSRSLISPRQSRILAIVSIERICWLPLRTAVSRAISVKIRRISRNILASLVSEVMLRSINEGVAPLLIRYPYPRANDLVERLGNIVKNYRQVRLC